MGMRFEDLIAWQEARKLVNMVYRLKGEIERDFRFRDQIRSASVSVMSNIAEGFERRGTGEKSQHYNVAKASRGEVRSQSYVLIDNELTDLDSAVAVQRQAEHTGRLTLGLYESSLKG